MHDFPTLRTAVIALLLPAALSFLSGCGTNVQAATPLNPSQPESAQNTHWGTGKYLPDSTISPSHLEAPPPTSPTPTPVGTGSYDFSQPVPASEAVDLSYFDDAIFIGNSRTEGFRLYAGPKEAQYFTSIGLMVNTIFSQPLPQEDGRNIPIMEAVADASFSKVYIMLGTNELGWAHGAVFQEKYGQIIDEIQRTHPQAQIYIQSILPVTQQRDSSDSIYNNQKIREYNGLLQELAQQKQVYYVNTAECVADSNGILPADSAFDGIHLKPEACQRWLEYLCTHTVPQP